jgi:hypothetical protein
MDDSPWRATTVLGAARFATVRGSVMAAHEALSCDQPGSAIVALAALDQAIDLLNGSDRQMGAFRGAEPDLLILDPLRQDEPSW